MISLIVAIGKNNVIGKDNRIPWRLPADLAYFKKVTTGHTVIMGRKTFESIGKPLPNRRNVIISGNRNYSVDDCMVCHSIEDALKLSLNNNEEIFVIGGANVYCELLPYAQRLYITSVEEDFEGDTFFPEIDYMQWTLVSKTEGEKNEKNPYNYYFMVFEKRI